MKPALPLSLSGRINLILLISCCLLAGLSLSADCGRAEDYEENGPDLSVSSVYGNLELGRPSSIFVVLKNGAGPEVGDDEAAFRRGDARSISAELISTDHRIKILSRPQLAGLLAGGESATLQFVALADGMPLGLYPLRLLCNYTYLSRVEATGDEGTPNLIFDYVAASQDLPLQAEIGLGPRIVIEDSDSWWRWWDDVGPGRESSLDLTLVNRGDEPAEDLQLEVHPSPPILMVENRWLQASIAPGERAQAGLSLFADENAASSYYALPCQITYRDGPGKEIRKEETAAVVYVGRRIDSTWIYLAGGLLALLLLIAAWRSLEKARSSRRRFRIVKS